MEEINEVKFNEKRRQQFIIESYYKKQVEFIDDVLNADDGLQENLKKPESEPGLHMDFTHGIGSEKFDLLLLQYTAGEPIEPLREELEKVIAAYERYGEYLWKYEGDRNVPVFDFVVIDDYCQLMQIVGLCFLLHRRDLLPRVAALQDGENGHNGGADNLYEEFMSHGLGAETRYESDWLCATKPYQALSDALFSENNDSALTKLHEFLRRWYKELAGCGWHDSHIADANGNQGGYYGYWSFEAGAAVVLLGIEDDSSLHQYLYYPKDLVAWYRANAHLLEETQTKLRCEANEPCPKAGYWSTPAKLGSRRHFKQGEIMPDFPTSTYGVTIWMWDQHQN